MKPVQQQILLKWSFLDRNSFVSMVSYATRQLRLLVRLLCSMCTLLSVLLHLAFSNFLFFNLERDPYVLWHTSVAFDIKNSCVFATYTIRRTMIFKKQIIFGCYSRDMCCWATSVRNNETFSPSKGESCNKPLLSFQQTLESQVCWGSYWHCWTVKLQENFIRYFPGKKKKVW